MKPYCATFRFQGKIDDITAVEVAGRQLSQFSILNAQFEKVLNATIISISDTDRILLITITQ